MKVLIIDDIEDSVKGIKDYCEEKGWNTVVKPFDDVYRYVMEFDPHIIILDWCKEPGDDTGNGILDTIWTNGYRPIVIFSGNADIIEIDDKQKQSTMLEVFSKGDEEPVNTYLEENEPYLLALAVYRKQVGSALVEAFNAIKPISTAASEYPGDTIVKYILAKRTSTYFDIQYFDDTVLPPWGMYICPAVSKDLMVCDVIRANTESTDFSKAGLPEEYLIVLTPSCDLVASRPKVTHVLCAHCSTKKDFYCHNIKCEKGKEEQQIGAIKGALNKGYNDRYVALPEMVNVLPYITVDLKKIELIPLNEIATNINSINGHGYVRVLSIDSPFREQIVWAHMQNACRPGVPDRDTENWARELKKK